MLGACSAQPAAAPPVPNPIAGLPGWRIDHVADIMPALLRGCARLALTPPDQSLGGVPTQRGSRAGDWAADCAAARALPPGDEAAARSFLQTRFDLVALPAAPLSGYFEPEVPGSREMTRAYRTALMSAPADLRTETNATGHRVIAPYATRADIDAGALRRQRLDLLYLRSPVDLFFVQLEGAGRIDLPNGRVVRVGFAATNGQPTVPIGRILAERGAIPAGDVSAATIRTWLETHARDAREILEQDPAYTFFRESHDLSPELGPLGTLGVQLAPGRSLAVDPAQVPLGAPVWIDTTWPDGTPLQRLTVAQDTNSISALFAGWGPAAEDQANHLHAPARAWELVPKAGAPAMD